MTYKTIAGISTDMMALGIAGHNIKLATKKKKTVKDFLKAGTTNLAGLSLLKAQAQLVGEL